MISGGRSALRNEKLGGHEQSFHLTHEAADVVFDYFDGMKLANRYARRSGIHYKKNGAKTMHYQILPPEGFFQTPERIKEHEG